MLEFFDTIVKSLQMFITFFVNMITSFVDLFSKMPTYISMLTSSVSYLPSIFIPFALIGISLCVLLFILGR